MKYVYILESHGISEHFYVGITDDVCRLNWLSTTPVRSHIPRNTSLSG